MTKILLQTALELLRAGDIVGVPTDTVYGLAADMRQDTAVKKIFTCKGRPNDKPLIILFSRLEQVSELISAYPPGSDLLMQHFWPGALTLILPIHPEKISTQIRAGLKTTGFRIPQHPLLLELLDTFGPVVAPSANLSGEPAPLTADQVEDALGKAFPVLDGGPCARGRESTILTYQEKSWQILRQGAISAQEIASVLQHASRSGLDELD